MIRDKNYRKTMCVKICPKKARCKWKAVSVRAFHCRSAQPRHQMSSPTPAFAQNHCLVRKELSLVPFSTLYCVIISVLFTTEKIPSYFCPVSNDRTTLHISQSKTFVLAGEVKVFICMRWRWHKCSSSMSLASA